MIRRRVVALDACARNFATVMSGGVAYVLDEQGDFTERRCNLDSVDLEPMLEAHDSQIIEGRLVETRIVEMKLVEVKLLKDLVARHHQLTGSPRAAWILANWTEA